MGKVYQLKNLKKERVKYIFYLHLLMLFYSMGAVCSKLASGYPVMSMPFMALYLLVLLVLGVYALLWQKILKKLSLITAYANKAVTVIWGMVWGTVFLKEQIRFNHAIGAIIIILGVCFVVSEEGD